ncbi:MAG TPA: hypothetical protein VGX23_36805 [Actinocrinis sp.]|nr:hypothetical protein [Actinocrinis sp.]
MTDAAAPTTPLIRKLGIKANHVVALLGAPDGFDETLGPLPRGVTVHRAADGRPPADAEPFDVVVFFTSTRAGLTGLLGEVRPLMDPACGLWIAWPKKSSGRPSELTDDVVREIALPTGLVDNKVCAVDATWSGLRLVIRRELR